MAPGARACLPVGARLVAAHVVVAVVAFAALVATGCGDGPPVITLTRVELAGTRCDPPAAALQLYATALGDFAPIAGSGSADDALELDGVPPLTRELAISVLGLGVDDVVGRTGTLAPGRLSEGGSLPIVLSPPGIGCEGPTLSAPIARPLVARAGDGVLILGDATAAWFERTTARTWPITGLALPLDGAALAPLADGRALLLAEGAWQAFDPQTRAFSAPRDVARLHAGALVGALADGTVLIAGGCEAGAPPCVAVADALVFDPRADAIAPAFGLARARAGGHAAAIGERVWLVGGTGDDGLPRRDVELWASEGSSVFDVEAQTIAATPSGAAVILSDGGPVWLAPSGRTSPIASVGPRPGATLLALDDGSVLLAGGGAAGAPGAFTVTAVSVQPMSLEGAAEVVGHGGALLTDGLALLAGGAVDGTPRADVWLLRTSLAGPWDALRPEVFSSAIPTVLVPSDPGAVTRTGSSLRLSADGEDAPLASWAVAGAPVFGSVEVELTARGVDGAGLVALLEWLGPERHVELRLAPGAVPVLARARGGALFELCTGATPLEGDRLERSSRLRVRAAGGRVEAWLDDVSVLSCEVLVGGGRVGVGTIGATGALELLTIEGRRLER